MSLLSFHAKLFIMCSQKKKKTLHVLQLDNRVLHEIFDPIVYTKQSNQALD